MLKRLILIACFLPFAANALEQLGPTYPIVEPDFLVEIRKILEEKQASGQLAKLQKEAAERVKQHAEEPPALDYLTRTSVARTYFIDPTYVQPQSVYDNQGRLVAQAGQRVNPLEYVTLGTRMLFFDGRDLEQVATAFRVIEGNPDGFKLVLTGGRPFDMMRQKKVRVYFDQGGALTKRFGIQHVPALVGQDGYRLRIDELVPHE